MNVTHPNYGQNYRLIRAALRLGTFTVSEIQSLSGAVENTVYSFLHKLTADGPDYLEATELESDGRGRPRKRYSLTQAGLVYLTNLSYQMASRFAESEAEPEHPKSAELAAMHFLRGAKRVILADSQAIFRTGVAKVLAVEDDISIVAQVDSFEKMLMALKKFHAGVLIFGNDLQSNLQEVVEAARRLKTKPVLIADIGQDPRQYLAKGVSGVIYRNVSSKALVECVRKVNNGETWVQNPQEIRDAAENNLVGARVRDRLTAKELKIVALIVQGHKNKEIAAQLGTTEQMVKHYLRNVYDKIGVSDRLALVLFTSYHRLLGEAAETYLGPAKSVY